jgi:hypothetical protein
MQAWNAVKDTIDIRTLEAFRRQYGAANPLYDRLAETRVDDLKRSQPPSPLARHRAGAMASKRWSAMNTAA